MNSTQIQHSPSFSAEKQKQARWAAASGFFGAIAEYYDFALYAPAAALLFGPLFFEPLGKSGALMASLAVFGVAYIVRPIGAIIFGSLGDTVGRKKVLMITLAMMGVATFCIGLLPTYHQVGVIAPILLVVLRICQGLAAGVEQSGSGTLSAEHAPKKKRGIYTSWTMMGVSLGWFLGPAVMTTVVGNESFLMSGGWRIPFLVALPIVLVALWIRNKVSEPTAEQKLLPVGDDPQFSQNDMDGASSVNNRGPEGVSTATSVTNSVKNADSSSDKPTTITERFPVVNVIVNHFPNLARVFFAALHMLVGVTCNIFVVGYAVNHQGMDKAAVLGALSFAGLSTTFLQPFFAALSDRVGRKPVFIASCIGLIIGFPFVMWSTHSGSFWVLALALTLFYVIVMAGNVVQASFYPELFPAEVRFTGVSLGTQLGLVVVGFSPMIYEAIRLDTEYGWWPGAVFAGLCWAAAALAAATAKPHR